MSKLKVLGISGSLRRVSYNRKALQIAKKLKVNATYGLNNILSGKKGFTLLVILLDNFLDN